MTRVALVTGAAGDIGAACSAALEREGLRVIRLDRTLPSNASGDWIVCDLADPKAVERTSAVLIRLPGGTGRVMGATEHATMPPLEGSPAVIGSGSD